MKILIVNDERPAECGDDEEKSGYLLPASHIH